MLEKCKCHSRKRTRVGSKRPDMKDERKDKSRLREKEVNPARLPRDCHAGIRDSETLRTVLEINTLMKSRTKV